MVLVDQGAGTWVEYLHLNVVVSSGETVARDTVLGNLLPAYDHTGTVCNDKSSPPHVHMAFLEGSGTSGQYVSMQSQILCGHTVDANGDLVGLGNAGGTFFAVPDCGVSKVVAPSSGSLPGATRVYEGVFVPTGSLTVARTHHSATLLADGRVLIAGGDDARGNAIAMAELYDPRTGTFSPTGNLTVSRDAHTATLLADGRVLIAGGWVGNSIRTDTAELYDPRTGMFSKTGSMTRYRDEHTATLLPDGRVLVAGDNTAELYDPRTGTFVPTGSMAPAHYLCTATLLPDGRVLVAGGEGSAAVNGPTAELYDPQTGTFSPTGSLTLGLMTGDSRFGHTATLLSDGRVLLVGGFGTGGATAELYDPQTGTFSPFENLNVARAGHTATLLADGRVLVTGGEDANHSSIATAELYDPQTRTFRPTASLAVARAGHTATLLPDGRILVTGGNDTYDTATATAELFQ
ncbi:MAG: hypothetical protein IVW52_20115 [Acidimicrobiales bacterium]|nr:hypothetical protein [Acidimicrobiales bacterium]